MGGGNKRSVLHFGDNCPDGLERGNNIHSYIGNFDGDNTLGGGGGLTHFALILTTLTGITILGHRFDNLFVL